MEEGGEKNVAIAVAIAVAVADADAVAATATANATDDCPAGVQRPSFRGALLWRCFQEVRLRGHGTLPCPFSYSRPSALLRHQQVEHRLLETGACNPCNLFF